MLISQTLKHSSSMNTLINLLGSDGNFANDSNVDGLADGWGIEAGQTLSAKSVSNNVQSFTASSIYGGIQYVIPYTIGHVLYICCLVKTTAANHVLGGAGVLSTIPNTGNWEFVSAYWVTSQSIKPRVQITNATTYGNVDVKKFHVFNLTQCFGSGREPSKTDMDSLMQSVLNSFYVVRRDYAK